MTLPAAVPAYALEIRAADDTAPYRARRWVAWLLESADVSQDTIDTVLLAVSELVTNAVVHGRVGGRVLVSAQVLDAGVRLVVHDDAPVVDWQEPGGLEDERGRGVLIVEAIAVELTITTDVSGTTVDALIPFEK